MNWRTANRRRRPDRHTPKQPVQIIDLAWLLACHRAGEESARIGRDQDMGAWRSSLDDARDVLLLIDDVRRGRPLWPRHTNPRSFYGILTGPVGSP